MKSPSLWKTVQTDVLSLETFLWIILIGFLYLFTLSLLLNYQLIAHIIAAGFPLLSILSLVGSLLLGSFTTMSAEPLTLCAFLLNAALVGLNLVLVVKAFRGLEKGKRIYVSLGGTTLFALVTAGCTSCGISLLSVLGLSATLAFLPFHGAELRIISLVLLTLSAFYVIKKLHEAKYCRI